MAKKGPMPNYKTVDDYILNQPKETQVLLNELRGIIHEAVPEVTEIINYKVPSFTLVDNGKKDQQIMIAAYDKFISFYPFPSTIEAFSLELKDYKKGKGSVQFQLNKALPKDLIIKMVKFRRDEILNSFLNK